MNDNSNIICTTPDGWDDIATKLLAEGKEADPDYIIEVDDGDGYPILSVTTRYALQMEHQEIFLFLEHLDTAKRAMSVGASFFVAVQFERSKLLEGL